jgi:UDP-N-acetylglucosamine 2-epimerase
MTPLGCIPLQDVRIIEDSESNDKKKKFILQTRHRKFNLQADDMETFLDWKQAIQANISANLLPSDGQV